MKQDEAFFAGLPVVTTNSIPDDQYEIVERTTYYRAIQMATPFICYTRHGSMSGGEAGDYIVVDVEGWPEPVSQDQFKEQFRKVDANSREG